MTGAARTSLSETFVARLLLTGPAALGAKPQDRLLGKGAFDVGRGLAYERVDLPGPVDPNKQPKRDYLVFRPASILLAPSTQNALPTGKSIISVPVSGPGASVSGARRFVAQAMALSPLLFLDEIIAGGTAAEKTATALVEHVHFADYRVTVDLRRALAGVDGAFAPAERIAIRQQLAALGPRRSTVEIAVRTDSAGFVRGLQAMVPGSKLGRVALDLHSYGIKLEPSRLARSQVISLRSLAGAWGWSPHWPWLLGA